MWLISSIRETVREPATKVALLEANRSIHVGIHFIRVECYGCKISAGLSWTRTQLATQFPSCDPTAHKRQMSLRNQERAIRGTQLGWIDEQSLPDTKLVMSKYGESLNNASNWSAQK